MSSSLVTSDPSASSKTRRRSRARVPNSIGPLAATNCRWRSSTRKRPNSNVASAVAGLDQARVTGELSRRTDCRRSCMSLSPVEGVEQQIEPTGALHAVPLHLRMNGCRLRIILIILSFRMTLKKPAAAATKSSRQGEEPGRGGRPDLQARLTTLRLLRREVQLVGHRAKSGREAAFLFRMTGPDGANSGTEGNALTCKPTERSRPSSDSRIPGSSSTIMTVGSAVIARARCNSGTATLRAAAIPQPEHPKIVRL